MFSRHYVCMSVSAPTVVCLCVWTHACVPHACAFRPVCGLQSVEAGGDVLCSVGSAEAWAPPCTLTGPPHPHPRRYFNCSAPGVQACSLPASCCLDPREDGASVNEQCGFGSLGLEEDAARRLVHVQGCGAPLGRWLRGTVRAAGGLAIAAALVQGAELLVAAHLLRALGRRRGAARGPVRASPPLTRAVDVRLCPRTP